MTPTTRLPTPVLRPCSLPDEQPPYLIHMPIINLFNDLDPELLVSHPPLSPSALPTLVTDDNQPTEGVKTSMASVSTPISMPHLGTAHTHTPCYLSLFLCHTLERLKDPDKVQPTVSRPRNSTTMSPQRTTECHEKPKKTPHIKEENATHGAVIVPQNTPLYEHVRKERKCHDPTIMLSIISDNQFLEISQIWF
ncbi:hypothetical protein EDB92DRAFT_1958036 [Lactarius akahatsu]|uniref:Uncharacterized protein n=1 Tax=Lactarius akahatsu TaxID=416441 RepID=A0AAD4L788_9AGAM|nr:hypothetical protein EDB92DRAFT_1958036 [Lactarius akahatsu]